MPLIVINSLGDGDTHIQTSTQKQFKEPGMLILDSLSSTIITGMVVQLRKYSIRGWLGG